MTNPVLRRALACAARGWPVFPCQPGAKTPATTHGYRDATTDEQQITAWFTGHPGRNLAIATGAPGPDVLDIDQHGDAGHGFGAAAGSATPGCSTAPPPGSAPPAAACTLYFTGTAQRCGHLPGCHLDFRSAGGYVLAPPSQVGGHPYRVLATTGQAGPLDWAAVTALLHPQRQPRLPQPRQGQAPGRDLDHLARWVAAQPEGNRNAGLFWAANRALETDPAADLSPLAAAARQAGLPDAEITRTLDSARRTSQPHPRQPDHQAEVN